LSFEEHGVEVIQHTKIEPRKEMMKAWTDHILPVYEEIILSLPKAADLKPDELPITREAYCKLFEEAVQETQRGVSLSMNTVVLIGRKKA
jgi:hypothetical protein